MTAPVDPQSLSEWSGPTVVRPDTDTRLDQLAAEYAALKPLTDEYAARLKAITDGIKAELTALHPDQSEILLIGSTVDTPLRLEAITNWRLDSTKLKSDNPNLWVRYAKQSTSWRLSRVRQS